MPPQTQPMVGEQVIVKFAPGTPAREVLASALAAGPESQARLAALAASLSAELNIPLRIERPTSGQEFVISINAGALASRLIAHLSDRADVKRVRLLEAGGGVGHRYWNPTVAVEFQAESTLGQTEHLKGFAAEVGDDVGFAVTARAQPSAELGPAGAFEQKLTVSPSRIHHKP